MRIYAFYIRTCVNSWMIFWFVTESNHFILRAHIYQARSLFGSDDTGLSGKRFRPTSIILDLQTAAEVNYLSTARMSQRT